MLQLHGGFRVRVKVSVRVLFRQTLDERMGPKVHFFLFFHSEKVQVGLRSRPLFAHYFLRRLLSVPRTFSSSRL